MIESFNTFFFQIKASVDDFWAEQKQEDEKVLLAAFVRARNFDQVREFVCAAWVNEHFFDNILK